MTDLNPDLIERVADVIDVRRHDYRVDSDTWVPYCTCGWTAEESYDVAAYDRHLAVAVLEAVAHDLRAEAWDEGFGAGHEAARHVNPEYPNLPTNPYREAGR